MTFDSQHISISIERPAAEVYAFAASPANLPRWAAGLGSSVERIEGEWVAESPMGRVKVAFAGPNDFGILDHDVSLPSGETVRNPMRVMPNGDGSELVFTLYRRPGMPAEEFAEDARQVRRDLARLKAELESWP